ncbi:MAG: SprT-like domain-containing protein [Cyclobacteriaceae bacterium]|nr:SprT-like domain-containing protein [Cyclobacteriaceae bacterium]
MRSDSVYSILKEHIPLSAVSYCLSLWQASPFELKLTKSRQTKVGDFTSRRTKNHPRITLNHDLNPYLFLLTFVHEVAHLHVYLRLGNRVDPHGEEWKSTFTDLMIPILQESVFPDKILHPLRLHMVNPKASSFADSHLTKVLREYDADAHRFFLLSDLPEGCLFQLQGKFFKKGKLRRTRVLCQELKTRRAYLVPADAQVTNVQLNFF